MDKLELKQEHLTPYLTHGLKCQLRGMHNIFEDDKMDVFTLSTIDINNGLDFVDAEDGDYCSWYPKDIFPILRPLNNLDSDEYNLESSIKELIIDKETESELSYDEWNYLLKNHFDIFGLIDAGLAIDINTL